MSGVEALGLACNVIQVISFAHETVAMCKDVYRGGLPNAHLRKNADALAGLLARLQAASSSSTSVSSSLTTVVKAPMSPEEQAVADMMENCSDAARALVEEVDLINKHHKKGSVRGSLRTTLKSRLHQAKLDGLQGLLNDWQRSMESHLLGDIWRGVAQTAQQAQDFQKFDADFQQFVAQVALGRTQLEQLIRRQSSAVMMHTTSECELTRGHMSSERKVMIQHARSEAESTRSHVSAESKTVMDHTSQQLVQLGTDMKLYLSEAVSGLQVSVVEIAREESTRIAHTVARSEIELRTMEERHERILRSLKFSGMNQRWNQVPNAWDGTFGWVFLPASSDSGFWSPAEAQSWDDFQDWLRWGADGYWIIGKPGSGKSTFVKFIVEHQTTRALLDVWWRGTVILSHFFWKGGGKEMQRNVKGFLCSLLHQLLSHNDEIFASVLDSSRDIETKGDTGDWTPSELWSLIKNALTCRDDLAFCIFVDGIDEVTDVDGAMSIVSVIEELWAFDRVKVCVSSRSELRFERRLGHLPHLPLHDLTKSDMFKFLEDTLENSGFIDYSLVGRSEGVFLWLHFAVRSLMKGIINGETQEELAERSRRLPSRLSNLFNTIWSKLDEDDPIDREAGSRFLNLALRFREYGTPRLAEIAVAANPALYDKWLDQHMTIDLSSLDAACLRTRDRIHLKCAGLLEVVESIPPDQRPTDAWDGTIKSEEPRYWNVQFVHRSTYEFIVDSSEGRQILELDPLPKDQVSIRVAKGMLVGTCIDRNQCITGRKPPFVPDCQFKYVVGVISSCSDPDTDADVHQLLLETQQRRERDATGRCTEVISHDFLGIAACFPGLTEYVLAQLKADPDMVSPAGHLVDFVVREVSKASKTDDLAGPVKAGAHGYPVETIRALLSLGGHQALERHKLSPTPSTRASPWPPYHHPLRDESTFRDLLGHPDFLRLLDSNVRDRPHRLRDNCQDLIRAFLEAHPALHLEERVVLVFSISGSGNTLRRSNQCSVSEFNKWYSSIEFEFWRDPLRRTHDMMEFVVVASLAFLVQTMCCCRSGGPPLQLPPEVAPTLSVPFVRRHDCPSEDDAPKAALYTLHGTDLAAAAEAMFRSFVETRPLSSQLPDKFIKNANAVREMCTRDGGIPYSKSTHHWSVPIMSHLVEVDCGYYTEDGQPLLPRTPPPPTRPAPMVPSYSSIKTKPSTDWSGSDSEDERTEERSINGLQIPWESLLRPPPV